MRTVPFAIVLLTGAVLSAALTFAGEKPKPATAMQHSAVGFLDSLSAEQKGKALFSFTDTERKNWHFVPRERKGLPLNQMDEKQRNAARALLQTGLSQKGYLKASTIMALENVLRELEKGTGPLRDPVNYYVSLFGAPPFDKGPWGWRFEGHHLAINVTIVEGKVAATPVFFGSNPAEVRTELGGMKGTRVLKDEEDTARALLASLTAEQKSAAILTTTAPSDILTGDKVRVDPLSPAGLPATKLSGAQKKLLDRVIATYTDTMEPTLAKERKDRLSKAGKDQIHFAWAGSETRGEKHYYRVQGPTFLIEYDNTQNDANHIHSVWRDFQGDFGEDLLAEHLAQAHASH